jgi:hypothetical protein
MEIGGKQGANNGQEKGILRRKTQTKVCAERHTFVILSQIKCIIALGNMTKRYLSVLPLKRHS